MSKGSDGQQNQDSESHPNPSFAPPRSNPGDLSIAELVLLLRPGQVWALVLAVTSVVSAAFLAGYKFPDGAAPYTVDAIAMTKPSNPNQAALRERRAVMTFESFLNAVSVENWDLAWDFLSDEWRAGTGSPSRIAREYRTTRNHDIHYIIPESIDDLREPYLVDMTYYDYIAPFPNVRV